MEYNLNDFQSLPEYVGTIRDDIQKVLDDNAIVKNMISNLQTEVATDIAQLSNRIDTNTSAINTTNTNLNSLTTKVNNNTTQLTNIQRDIVFINGDIRNLTESIDTINTTITDINDTLDKYSKIYSTTNVTGILDNDLKLIECTILIDNAIPVGTLGKSPKVSFSGTLNFTPNSTLLGVDIYFVTVGDNAGYCTLLDADNNYNLLEINELSQVVTEFLPNTNQIKITFNLFYNIKDMPNYIAGSRHMADVIASFL